MSEIYNKKEYLSFDQYQRYETVARLIEYRRQEKSVDKFRILELGANEHKDLQIFLPNDKILFTDIVLTEKMDQDKEFMRVDGTDLPFVDSCFDFVVAVDVLEHVPEKDRQAFIREAYRVAKVDVILSFPYDSKDVLASEERVNSYYKSISGQDFIWLKEHRENGLPNLNTINSIIGNLGCECFSFFHGDLQTWEKMWYCHFNAVFMPEALECRNDIDHYYNSKIYLGDVSDICYRVFYVLSNEVACLERYIDNFWKKNDITKNDYINQYLINQCMPIAVQELAKSQNLNKEMGIQLGEVRQELAETQRVMNETGAQLGEARQELAETQQVLNETGAQLGEARQELAETQQVLNETGAQLGEARQELAETQRVMNETGVQLGEARQDLAETQRVMNETGAQLGEARQDLAETQQVLSETGAQLGEARQELAEMQQVLVEKDEQLSSINDEKNKLINLCNNLEIAKQEILNESFSLRCQLSEREQLLAEIQKSFSWKITRPLYNVKTAIYFAMEKRPFTHKIRKAISILRHDGWSEFVRALKYHIKKKQEHPDYQQLPARNNKDGYKPYDAEYQDNQDFSKYKTDVKMLAFYLPQFHTFPENDEWWGKGFTEWVNVKNGDVRFVGHYQPRVPHQDIGYYCLDDINVMKQQAELAKQHGIYGFCFYYYWFSGKRLMERPVDMLLVHPEIDLPFCLCWANENWTRAWDGQNKNVLIGQEYSENDDEQFIKDLEKYIDDSRYIKINGKPLIIVYNPGHIPNCHKSFSKWREVAKNIGLGDILIWTCQTANNTAEILNITDCVDAEVEFPPHNMWLDSIAVRDMELGGKSAFIYNYQCLVNNIAEDLKRDTTPKLPIHHSCMMAWDNAARRKDAWFTFYAFSLKSLYDWVRSIAERARKDFKLEERFVFINAWNEWGEGTYLEPDEKYGYANINTVSKALLNIPLHNDLQFINHGNNEITECDFEHGEKARIAVQIHMFYLDTLDEVIENINKIPFKFDCFISTDTDEKQKVILEAMQKKCRANIFKVEIFLNRGRDVAPFLVQLAPVFDEYDYICHIHSKKTATNDHGNEWRKYNFTHLFGSADYLKRVFYILENNKKIGIAMPETYPVLELQAEWGGNQEGVETLLHKMDLDYDLPKDPVFPVGNMFWARTDAVKKLFALNLQQEDFPEEAGQVNATLAHQIERVWVYVAACAGYSYCKIFNNCLISQTLEQRNRLVVYVHFDQNNVIAEDDVATIAIFSKLCSKVVFVTNSHLSDDEVAKVRPYASTVILRENIGFDFGAWRDCLLKLGQKSVADYDELILLNNSCFAPVFDINEMFETMENKNLDFWGNTIFPYSSDGSYIGKDCIPEHLQSYFMVFNKKVLNSDVFWNFWRDVKDCEDLIEVIANYESQLTLLLSQAGFKYEPYIRETYYMSRFLNNYAIPYEKPTSLILLKDPFVKKKCYQHMNDEEKIKLEWFIKEIK